jgi:hypothetical protein
MATALAIVAGAFGASAAPAVAATVGTCAPASDTYSKSVLSTKPVAYYRLDDASGAPMCDASTQVNNGAYASSGVTHGAPGALPSSKDTSVSADGTPGVIGNSNNNAAISGNTNFSYEAWFRNSGAAQNQALVDVGQSGNGNIAGLATWDNVNSFDCSTPNASDIALDEYAGSNCWDTTTAGVNIFDGDWHYLVVTYNASTATVTAYADAHNLGAQHVNTGSGAFNLAASPVRVGDWIDSVVNQAFRGGLDEVAVYPTALSSKQVLSHYKAAGFAPKIKKLSPNAGPTAGGNTVTITGGGFTSDATVDFGSTPATSVTRVSLTELQAVAPAGSGVVRVSVHTYVGTSPSAGGDLYAYGPPSVSSISPTSGPTSGGTTVTITGAGFVPGAKVHFGSTLGSKIKFVSPTTLTAVSPIETAGSVDVTVTTAAGTSATSPADVFTYSNPTA